MRTSSEEYFNMTVTRRLNVNGRFLGRPASGVDRVAIELIIALATRSDIERITLLHPPTDKLHLDWLQCLNDSCRAKIRLKRLGVLKGHLWEQIVLLRAARSSTLLNLCNTAPALRRNQIVMIHDSQVWDEPQSYSRTFRLIYRLLLPVCAHSAQRVLTVSEFSRNRIESLGIAPKGRTRVIPNGSDHIVRIDADPDTLERHGLVSHKYFVVIGNLAPHKNLALLIDAAAARSDGGPELVVVGGMNSHVFASNELQNTKGVRFLGRVSDAELKTLYEKALALAFPSLTEGFGLPPVEAMRCGCPVIATTGGAVPEVCGDAALYVDPTDRAGWTDALVRMADDASLRTELSNLGFIRCRDFTWDRAAQRLVDLLQ